MILSVHPGDESSAASGSSTGIKAGVIAGGIVGGLSGFAVLGCVVYFLMRRRRSWHGDEHPQNSKNENTHESHKDEDRESAMIEPFYSKTNRWLQSANIPNVHDRMATIYAKHREAYPNEDPSESDNNSLTEDTQSYWPTATSTITSVRSMADRIRRGRGLRTERGSSSSRLVTLIRSQDQSLRNEVENLRREVQMIRHAGRESESDIFPPMYMDGI